MHSYLLGFIATSLILSSPSLRLLAGILLLCVLAIALYICAAGYALYRKTAEDLDLYGPRGGDHDYR
jgi:hypothetical protein